MSFAPAPLVVLRRYARAVTGLPAANFSIRTSKGDIGYHLSPAQLHALGKLGNPKTAGLRKPDGTPSNAASAIDFVGLPKKQVIALTAHLVAEAQAGRIPELAEIIGPGLDGKAYRWAAPGWKRTLGRKDHTWHLHLGLKRKTWLGDVDLIGYFEPVLGPRPVTLSPDEEPPDEEPNEPKPTYEELETERDEAIDRAEAAEAEVARIKAAVCG